MLSFVFILTLIKIPTNINATTENVSEGRSVNDTYIKIRYNATDDSYEGWNFWIWERIQ